MAHVTHHPRLALDGAMMFVGAARHDDLYGWLAPALQGLLGEPGLRAFVETRYQLYHSARPDAANVECGRWRARLEELLANNPTLAEPLRQLTFQTRHRLF